MFKNLIKKLKKILLVYSIMSRKILKYRVYCITEDKYEYTWNDTTPLLCPTNAEHTIDTNTISIIDTVETHAVNIIQELSPTGGNYRTEGKKMTIQPNSLEYEEYSWPYNISALTMTFYTNDNSSNDVLNCYVGSNTIIGITVDDAIITENILRVNSTVLDNINIGYQVCINNEFIGECVAINKINGTITIDTPLTQNISTGTHIQMTVNNIKDFILKANTVYEFARKTIGASSIPANTNVKLKYQNNSNEEKSVYFSIEYMY